MKLASCIWKILVIAAMFTALRLEINTCFASPESELQTHSAGGSYIDLCKSDTMVDPRKYIVLTWNNRTLWDCSSIQKGQSEIIGREGVLRIDFNRKRMKDDWNSETKVNLSISASVSNWDGGSRNIEVPGYSVIAKEKAVYQLDLESASHLVAQILQGSRFLHRIQEFDLLAGEERDVETMKAYKTLTENYLSYLGQTESVLSGVYQKSLRFTLSSQDIMTAGESLKAAEQALKKQEDELQKARNVEYTAFFRRVLEESTTMKAWLEQLNAPENAKYLDVYGQIIERDPKDIAASMKEFYEILTDLEKGKISTDNLPVVKEAILTKIYYLYEIERQVVNHYRNLNDPERVQDSQIAVSQLPRKPRTIDAMRSMAGGPAPDFQRLKAICDVRPYSDSQRFATEDLVYVPEVVAEQLSALRNQDAKKFLEGSNTESPFHNEYAKCEEARGPALVWNDEKANERMKNARMESIDVLISDLCGSERYKQIRGRIGEKFEEQLKRLLAKPTEWNERWKDKNSRYFKACVIRLVSNEGFEVCRERNDVGNTAIKAFIMADMVDRLIGDLPTSEIRLDDQNLRRGDQVVLSVSFLGGRPATKEQSVPAPLQQAVFSFEATPFGWNGLVPRITDSTIYAKGKNQENFEPRSGASALWNYYGTGDKKHNPLRLLAPGVGMTAMLLNFAGQNAGDTDQDKSTVEFGIGPTVSLFDNLVQFTYGWNLSNKSGEGENRSRRYVGIGISFYETFRKLSSKKDTGD